MGHSRIEDHGIIGDGRSAALVASDGTIDWLCWPRFDSAATFAALLGDASAGAWELRLKGAWTSEQAYLADTNVLATTFRAPGARVLVTDLMPVATPEDARRLLIPEHELLRVVECLEGEAELETSIRLAPGFGRHRLRASDRGVWGLCVETSAGAFFLRAERPLTWADGRVAAFESWGAATWWSGAAVGAVHATGVLVLGMPFLPGIHPRMASEHAGPTAHRQLEPPGFLALHYGRRTPISIVAAHLLFGAVLGTFYRVI